VLKKGDKELSRVIIEYRLIEHRRMVGAGRPGLSWQNRLRWQNRLCWQNRLRWQNRLCRQDRLRW
jgi:hypothetical protein